jgi:hypothetical protein
VYVRCLLTCYGPPYYGMGSLLYRLPGGYALWPGWMGRVTIRPTLSGGYGPWQPFAGRGCAMAVVRFPVRGAVTRPCCDPEEVILPLRGGVYGSLTPSGDCPALCGGFRSGGPFRGQSGDRHGDFRGLVARARIHRSKGRRCLGRGCRPYVCGHPPEGGFEDLVCSNGQCVA